MDSVLQLVDLEVVVAASVLVVLVYAHVMVPVALNIVVFKT